MSKRFGRNQKRRMREALLSAELAHQISAYQASQRKQRISELEKMLWNIERLLQKNSVAFPAKSIESENINAERIAVDNIQTIPIRRALFAQISPIYIQYEFMAIMKAIARKNPLDLGVHCFVTFDDMRWGYAINQRAIKSMPQDLLAKQVASSMAPLIAQSLKECFQS